MKRIFGVLLSVAIAFVSLSCGGPKNSNSHSSPNQETVQDSTRAKSDTTVSVMQPTTKEAVSTKHGKEFPEWILLVIVIVEGGCIAWLWMRCNKHEKMIDRRMNERKKDIGILQADLNELRKSISKPTPRITTEQTARHGQVQTPQSIQEIGDVPISTPSAPPTQQPRIDSDTLFLEHYGDGILKVVSSKDQAHYQVEFPVGQNIGQFEFIGDARKAIKNKNAILDNVCEASTPVANATHIHTDRWGTCIRQADGTWKVTQKAIISFK